MKILKLLFLILVTTMVTSCTVNNEIIRPNDVNQRISLNELISGYDLWYVDYHQTKGNSEIPFLSRAFTISFINGTMYANNNIAGVGKTGNGLGIAIGNYNAFNELLETSHRLDGNYSFEVLQISDNEIRINDIHSNVSYLLVGYQRDNFDYKKLFYENIEYLLQEYSVWERVEVNNGNKNAFDQEHFLKFTAENDATFYSSKDHFGTSIAYINWGFIGKYTVYDVTGYKNLKGLRLSYRNGDEETFELKIRNSRTIELYHHSSQTTYLFLGKGFLQFLRESKAGVKKVKENDRKRTKIIRKKVDRKFLK